MINRKKLTKKIWYHDELWDFHTVMSPTPWDDYIVLTMKTGDIHVDGTPAIIMTMVDAHNEEFYPSNRTVDAIMKKRAKAVDERCCEREVLTRHWLKMFPEESTRVYADDPIGR